MGVYKRPECEWKGKKPTWYFQFTHNRVKHYGGIYKTRKEAHDAEQAKLNELKSKRAKQIPRIKATFSELLPRFIAHRKVIRSARTVEGERRRGMVFERHFGKVRVSNITLADLNEYVAMRKEEGLAPRSINLDLSFLRSFFKYAIENGAADCNPAKEVDAMKQVKSEKWIPSKDELQRFADCAAKTSTGKFIVPWIWFRAYTGTRPSESVFMEWDDIDFENDRIHIRPKNGNELKNGKFRVVEMHPELKPILLEWKKEWQEIHDRWWHKENTEARRRGRGLRPDHQWVFVNPRRHGQRASCFYKAFYEARDKAGLPSMNSYTLRHYFISQCVMSGINLFTIAKWCGHANTLMIQETYGHLNSEFRREQMAMLKVV